jgi:hypothetical protein
VFRLRLLYGPWEFENQGKRQATSAPEACLQHAVRNAALGLIRGALFRVSDAPFREITALKV